MYRIRQARVEVCNGYRCWREKRFGAERRISAFGIFYFWWPVSDFGWRATREQAEFDAMQDANLREPLEATSFVSHKDVES